MMRFARQYFCKELEKRGRKFIKKNFHQILRVSKEYELLPAEDVIDILQDDELNVRNEEIVFEAVQKWVDYDHTNRDHYVLDLLKVVRIGNLSIDYSTYTILEWPPVTKSEVY